MKPLRIIILLVWMAAFIPAAHGFREPDHGELPDFDKRPAKDFRQKKAQPIARLKASVPRAKVDFDFITGAPKSISAPQFLSGKNGKDGAIPAKTISSIPANDPHRVTKAFIQEHRQLFGHGPEILNDAAVERDFTTKHNGLKTTVWQQQLDGIPIFEAVLVSHVTKNQELVSLSSQFVPDAVQAANNGLKNRGLLQKNPKIPPQRAIVLAAKTLDEFLDEGEITPIEAPAKNAVKQQKFKSRKLAGISETRLVWLPMSETEMRLCWDVFVTSRTRGEMFEVLIDAKTGEALVRHNLTHYLSEASYRVFVSDSPMPFSPGFSVPQTNQPSAVPRVLVATSALNTNASPLGWISDGENETLGNNVDAHTDQNGDDAPDLPRPQGSPTRVFDFPLDLEQDPSTYSSAAVVQLFYWCNWMHDKLYELGFTEAAGNFQADNFGRGGFGNDALQADAQDSSALTFPARNNANFTTPRDGVAPRMQMYLFNYSQPNRDGSLDAEIILHEYTHGLSNRRVGGGVGMSALQSRGLGEGWSDFYALALLSEPGDDPNGNYAASAYSTADFYFGIRRYPYSTDLSKNPLTFKDIDPSIAGSHPGIPRNPRLLNSASEVHNQGEVWCVALWEMRANLIVKHGFEAGNQLTLQLVTDALNLTPANPNFLQARDAILLADQVNNDGANQHEIWAAFAKRGLGFFAVAPASSTTTGVIESFSMPDDLFVNPPAEVVSSGPTGGPFSPLTQTYALANIGTNAFDWTIFTSANWLNVSQTNGTLAMGENTNVIFSLNLSEVSVLAAGIYTNTLIFSNATSGFSQARNYILRVGQPDFFTQLFNKNDFNLSNQCFTFTPDGSAGFYSVCRDEISAFPTDPTGGNVVVLADDSNVPVTLASNATVSFFGVARSNFFIGSNGYLTFESGDSNFSETLARHSDRPRISGLFRDLNPALGGNVSWKQLGDRVAVTFFEVAESGLANTNTFQIELFYNGVLRLSYLKVDTRNGLVGLSRGNGIPENFVESAFSNYPTCAPHVGIFVPASATEGDGVLTGMISLPGMFSTNVTVKLYTSDFSKAAVPTEITLPSGETNAAFDLAIVDNAVLDGTQPVTIRATAPGYLNGAATISVFDNESVNLSISMASEVDETQGAVFATLELDAAPAKTIFVGLNSSDSAEVTVTNGIFISAGETSATFPVSIQNNSRIDGNRPVTITAHVENWVDGTANFTIHDDENTDLKLAMIASAREGNGVIPTAGSVKISGTLQTNLIVSLVSTSASVIAPVQIEIPAGNISAPFDLEIQDDADLNGLREAEIQASAFGFNAASALLTISDDEIPNAPTQPLPSDFSSNNSVNVDLSWNRELGEGAEKIVNGKFETGDLSGWTIDVETNASFTINDGSYAPLSGDNPTAPFDGNFSLLAEQNGGSSLAIWQEVAIPNDAETVTFGWADRIRNFGFVFSTNQEFRMELRDTNNFVLTNLFKTSAESAFMNDWTQRVFDISDFRGKTVRPTFVVKANSLHLDVHLDDISLRVANPPLTSYDVYFGTNAVPDVAEFLGTTTNRNWILPPLEPLTTYFWKVVARRSGETNSPIWQFRTAPEISIQSAVVEESDFGTNATVNVALSFPSDQIVTVEFFSANGTAKTPADFNFTDGTLTFNPGETNAMIAIPIVGDARYEQDETFFVRLRNAVNAALGDDAAEILILNDDPVFAPISDQIIEEGALVNFRVDADDFAALSTNTLLFTLENAPEGAGIDPESGVFTWEPTETQAPGIFTITIRVSDSGSPEISGSQSFQVTVNEVNSSPVLSPIFPPNNSVSICEGDILFFTNIASDVDFPANTLTFSLDPGAPEGAQIDSATGVFSWTPTEGQGPGMYSITVRVTDDGLPNLSAAETLFVMVNEWNSVPDLSPISDYVVAPGTMVSFFANASDSDFPANTLSFSLLSGAPIGAQIDSMSGEFTWTPDDLQGPSTNEITVQVTDDGFPARSATQTFVVIVEDPVPFLQSVAAENGVVTLTWSALAGRNYQVQFKTNFDEANWTDVGGVVSANGSTASQTDVIGAETARFYRVMLLP